MEQGVNRERVTDGRWSGGLAWVGAMAAGLAVAVLARLPFLANAEALFDSDMGFNALAVKHLLAGQARFLYYPGQNYQGITEGLLGMLWIKLLGWSALGYELAAFTFFAAGLVVTYALVRALRGPRAGWCAMLLAAVCAPGAMRFSLFPAGGHMAAAAAGAGLLACAIQRDRSGQRRWTYVGCLVAGIGFYTYRLSVVAILPWLAYGVYRSGVCGVLRRPRTFGAFILKRRREGLTALAWLMLGLLPVLAAGIWLPPDRDSHALGTAPLHLWWRNACIHVGHSLPRLFGTPVPAWARRVQAAAYGSPAAYVLTLLALGVALYAAWQAIRRDARQAVRLSGAALAPTTLMLGFAVTPLAAAIVSSYTLDTTSVRYLVPMLFPVYMLTACVFDDWGGMLRARGPARGGLLALTAVVMVVCASACLRAYGSNGFMSFDPPYMHRLRTAHRMSVDYLLERGVRRAYGPYWVAYHETFLAGEKLIVAPYRGQMERKPPDYTALVRRDPDPAYVFRSTDNDVRHAFKAALRERGLPFVEERLHGARSTVYVYHSAGVPFPHDL